MKYWVMFLVVGFLVLLLVLSFTPQKKLKCVDDMCMVLEKTFWHPKSRIKQYFFKSDVRSVVVETNKGVDYLVIKTKSSNDIYLKFIHTSKTAFESKAKLSARMNQFFMNLIHSDKDYESPWQRDVGAMQIYVFGKPLFK
ncbi:hypothetical protein IAC76_02070 [Spirochaetes bacterium]|uniref:Uncharacterized protein n=1 Tax=Candidatus Scatousia excrementipullorum TaxID=2840936 RepID=A0A9D9DML9_9BACT|nr:hypothetical protein [Candidatus Scatousia excrementipullorum]